MKKSLLTSRRQKTKIEYRNHEESRERGCVFLEYETDVLNQVNKIRVKAKKQMTKMHWENADEQILETKYSKKVVQMQT